MDVSILYFAVPFISTSLAPRTTEQLWIFDIYGFVLCGLLLTMGSLGDRIGRRRLLLIGAGMHVVAVVAAGIMLCAATVCATALRSASTPAGSSEPAKPSSAVLG
ncbi:MAG: hypothetical protein ACR2FF_03830 [Mycobacteriales bacterium]